MTTTFDTAPTRALLTPADAEAFASELLTTRFPRTWERTIGVAAAARTLTGRLSLTGRDANLLQSGGWLYAVGVGVTCGPQPHGWHPLAGALLLRGYGHTTEAGVVAWNAAAEEEAHLLGLDGILHEFPHYMTLAVEAVTYADLHTGEDGSAVTPEQRLVQVRARHGQYSTAAQALEQAWPRLSDLFARVEGRFLSD